MAMVEAAMAGVGLKATGVSGCIIANNRETMAESTLAGGGATHLLFLDDDMRFPPDTITRLLAHGKQIVGVNYVRRCDPPTPVSVGLDGKMLYTTPEDKGIEQVKSTATGIMLIAVEVFRSMGKPWFDTRYDIKRGDWYTEDVVFCHKAIEHGFEVWVDHDLSRDVGHMGTREYCW